jgi:hypothetical protein
LYYTQLKHNVEKLKKCYFRYHFQSDLFARQSEAVMKARWKKAGGVQILVAALIAQLGGRPINKHAHLLSFAGVARVAAREERIRHRFAV